MSIVYGCVCALCVVFCSVVFSMYIAHLFLVLFFPLPLFPSLLSLFFYSHLTSKICGSRPILVFDRKSKQFKILTVPSSLNIRRHAERVFIAKRIVNETNIAKIILPLPHRFSRYSFFFSLLPRLDIEIYCATNGIPFSLYLRRRSVPPPLIPPSNPSPSFAQGREEYQFLTGDSVTVRETDAITVKLTFFTGARLLNSLPPPAYSSA